MRAGARLPANLRLRGHARSLMFFVSMAASNSSTHFDDTPSVLTCLSGTRTVWLAPPEVQKLCSLAHRPQASSTIRVHAVRPTVHGRR